MLSASTPKPASTPNASAGNFKENKKCLERHSAKRDGAKQSKTA
jgi:hypothetical protein